MAEPIHILATADLAERVLLPGDPGRALTLAQSLLRAPKMFNHNRGLWGYTGDAIADGRPLTIQSTGIGGPSAAIVVSELADLGARTFVRVGTCGSLTTKLGVGELVIVTEAICEDGTSRALTSPAHPRCAGDGPARRVAPAPELLARLISAGRPGAASSAVSVSTDLFYDRPVTERDRWAAQGAAVVELEAATVLALGRRRGLDTAALLLVADVLGADGSRQRIDLDRLRASEQRLGELAARALSA